MHIFIYIYAHMHTLTTIPKNHHFKNCHKIEGHHHYKREAISRFMFHMAFENSIESGYVTEKPFDALLSGMRTIDAFSIIC
jgi:Glycosyltransferase family 10 (fucosyltransferase) C-term